MRLSLYFYHFAPNPSLREPPAFSFWQAMVGDHTASLISNYTRLSSCAIKEEQREEGKGQGKVNE